MSGYPLTLVALENVWSGLRTGNNGRVLSIKQVANVGQEVERLKVSRRIEPVLERVLTGQATPELAVSLLDVSEYELGVLLRALIRQRSKEQRWEFTD